VGPIGTGFQVTGLQSLGHFFSTYLFQPREARCPPPIPQHLIRIWQYSSATMIDDTSGGPVTRKCLLTETYRMQHFSGQG
jgi:hypothetical protein